MNPMLAKLIALCAAALLVGCGPGIGQVVERTPAVDGADPSRKVLFIAGPDSHGPSAHEHRAGSLLLADALERQFPDISATVVYGGWPGDPALLEAVDAVVLYCDGGSNHVINDHLDVLGALLDRGVGVAALHYCVEVPKGSPSSRVMLQAIGGYFETDWSVNPHWEANFTKLPRHPATAGVQPFELLDEWYFNMRFVEGGAGVTPLLDAVPPPSTMERSDGPHSGNPAVRAMVAAGQPQIVGWAYERPEGGRGFGFTGGHFHDNWSTEPFRRLVINAIAWIAEGHTTP